jgi:hypothetical protein
VFIEIITFLESYSVPVFRHKGYSVEPIRRCALNFLADGLGVLVVVVPKSRNAGCGKLASFFHIALGAKKEVSLPHPVQSISETVIFNKVGQRTKSKSNHSTHCHAIFKCLDKICHYASMSILSLYWVSAFCCACNNEMSTTILRSQQCFSVLY